MKDFANIITDAIIRGETPRIDSIMRDVTDHIRDDFLQETYKLIDKYYDSYVPIRYVRLYGKKRTLRTKSGTTKRRPKQGGISLHAAIMRMGMDPAYAISEGNYYNGYRAGIIFDSNYFQGNGMRHIGKGSEFREWNIVENFLFAGEGHYGDVRYYPEISGVSYSEPSADAELMAFMNNYRPKFDMYYKNALKKF